MKIVKFFKDSVQTLLRKKFQCPGAVNATKFCKYILMIQFGYLAISYTVQDQNVQHGTFYTRYTFEDCLENASPPLFRNSAKV